MDIHGELDLFIALFRHDEAAVYQRQLGGEAQVTQSGSLLVLQTTRRTEAGTAAADPNCIWARTIPAMAAAVRMLLGGTAEQVFDSASLSIQNQLGLVCDPVACQTETPCIGRNAQGAAAAILAARMVLGGFPALIPFGEVIGAMYKVGLSMDLDLLCNGKGGVCITPTAQRVTGKVRQWSIEEAGFGKV